MRYIITIMFCLSAEPSTIHLWVVLIHLFGLSDRLFAWTDEIHTFASRT